MITTQAGSVEDTPASWANPYGWNAVTRKVQDIVEGSGGILYLQEFLSIAVLGWRYPAATGAALDVLSGQEYDFAQVLLQSGAPATEAWIYGAVQGALNKDRDLYVPSDALIVQGLPDPNAPWGIFKTLKWVLIGGALLLGVYLVFKTVGAGKSAGVIAG
jgi:hypothetical protein